MRREDLVRTLLEETTQSTDPDEAREAARRLAEDDAAEAALRAARDRRGY